MMRARIPVVLPVKALSLAKQRLAPVLTADERRQLVLAMLADVLDTLATVDFVGPVMVVTPDPDVASLARSNGASVIVERTADGLNSAVQRGLADGRVQRGGQALILPGDVPLASAQEIETVIGSSSARERPRIALVPSQDGDGTNALLLSPPDIIAPNFGVGSFLSHLAAAVARRIDAEVLQLGGLATDIDTPDDLDCLLRSRSCSPRYAFLQGRSDLKRQQPFVVQEDRK